jgi:GntR family transcriptional regulator, transcriptional repressor for pyruvate dehydrogenase complex
LARTDTLRLAELLQFRMLLEGSAYQLAAHLRTPEQLAEMTAALTEMDRDIEVGYPEFSRADVAFHDAVARATQNTLIMVCGDVVRGVVLDLIEDKLAHAGNQQAQKALMRKSLAHHHEVLTAVRDGDGALASRLARQALYDYYAEYVSADERAMLLPLL